VSVEASAMKKTASRKVERFRFTNGRIEKSVADILASKDAAVSTARKMAHDMLS